MFLKCLFYFFKFFGIAPMSINTSASKKNGACEVLFVSSRLGTFFNFIFICLLIFISYFLAEDAITWNSEHNRSLLETFQDTGCAIIAGISSLVILMNIAVNKDKFIAIINKLNNISQRQKIEFKSSIQFIRFLRTVKIIVLTNLIMMMILSITLLLDDIVFLLYVPIIVIYYGALLQYSLILKLLHYFYRSINADLQSVLSSTICILIFNDRSLDTEIQRIIEKIKQLRESHVLLSHLSQDVSDFYALTLFFCTMSRFFILIQTGYLAVILQNPQEVYTGYEAALIHFVIYIIVDILSLMILARAAGLTVTESKRTGKIVGGLIAVDCHNELILCQLNGFSSYLVQVQVYFSVFNLFLVDESLLTSIASSTTTYMVILLQFKDSYTMENGTVWEENTTSLFVNETINY